MPNRDAASRDSAGTPVDAGQPRREDEARSRQADLPGVPGSSAAIADLQADVQRAETALSDANERGNASAIQKAETRLSNAMERLDRYRGKRKASAATRRTYMVKVYFGATPDEYDALSPRVMEAVETALGCTGDPEHVCPHFEVATSGPRRYEGRRFWALRCGLRGLWEAVRYGEV